MKSMITLFGLLLTMLASGPLAAQAGTAFSSTYTASAGTADVSITNTGTDALYNLSLQPAGPAADATPLYVGTMAAGGSANVRINLASNMGYMVFNASGTDAAGQPVQFSIVSEGR